MRYKKVHVLKGTFKRIYKTEGTPDNFEFISNDAYVASCLRNGKIVGYKRGTTFITIKENSDIVAMIKVIVLPWIKKSFPVYVNRRNGVGGESFTPENLITVEKGEKHWNSLKDIRICKEAATAYVKMSEAAEIEGIHMRVIHGYRSYDEQLEILEKLIKTNGEEKARSIGAPAGFSEHHTGLAMDVGGEKDEEGRFITSNKEVYKWIEDNCYVYGFMLKNLKGKEHITGTKYEPWHIRYIGDTDITKLLHDQYWTYDEYLEYKSENPDEPSDKTGEKATVKSDNRDDVISKLKGMHMKFTKKNTGKNTRKIIINFIGDVMTHGNQIKAAYDEKEDRYNFDDYFSDIIRYNNEADLSVCNFETTMGGYTYGISSIQYSRFNR